MKLTLIGYGKMGKIIERAALERGHEIVSVVDPFSPEENSSSGLPLQRSIKQDGSDICIEFTRPDTACANIIEAARQGLSLVCGTTGWHSALDEAGRAVLAAKQRLLWATNFSLGVNAFYRIAQYAASLVAPFEEYDAAIFEIHHNKKADAPSGTAKTLAQKVAEAMPRKKDIECASLRVGAVPGQHTLIFDSAADTIEISHTARSREGFALGAVRAAEWLSAVTEPGIYTMDDVLKDILK